MVSRRSLIAFGLVALAGCGGSTTPPDASAPFGPPEVDKERFMKTLTPGKGVAPPDGAPKPPGTGDPKKADAKKGDPKKTDSPKAAPPAPPSPP